MIAERAKGVWAAVLLASTLAVVGCAKSGTKSTEGAAAAASPERAKPAKALDKSATAAERAIAQARVENKHAFILFHRPAESEDRQMADIFAHAEAKLRAKAVFVLVDVNSRAEARLIDKYQVRQAPLPLILVMAPNGAVVNAFTKPVEEKALADAFVSPKVAEVSKALQDKKLVALCLQGAGTQHNTESRQAAQQFVGDSRLGGQALLVTADPANEPGLLKRCGMQKPPAESTIVLLLPPGQAVAMVSGATTKGVLLTKLQAAIASCGSGCGPSGCGQ
jgi:hypothetical protein